MSAEKKINIIPYKNEPPLFYLAGAISVVVWCGLLFMTKGAILAIVPFVFLVYLFAQSGFVSYLKGTGALVSTSQFHEIQSAVESCAGRIGLRQIPQVYILHMDGMFNAFALRFLHKHYVVLLSDVVDAMDKHPDSLRFYIGHEMAHLHRNHTLWEVFLMPALILPLLGAAYSRAREYTCDRYGAACCENAESARRGLAALAVGGAKYMDMNEQAYLGQIKETKGFWMSFHEIIANYPWLVKRFARAGSKEEVIPNRNPLAYIFAIFVPRLSITSLIVIYLFFVIGMGGLMEKMNKSGILSGQLAGQDYSSYQGESQQYEEFQYEVGKVYEGDPGYFYEYLGGDPDQATSWKEVSAPENSTQPEPDSSVEPQQ